MLRYVNDRQLKQTAPCPFFRGTAALISWVEAAGFSGTNNDAAR